MANFYGAERPDFVRFGGLLANLPYDEAVGSADDFDQNLDLEPQEEIESHHFDHAVLRVNAKLVRARIVGGLVRHQVGWKDLETAVQFIPSAADHERVFHSLEKWPRRRHEPEFNNSFCMAIARDLGRLQAGWAGEGSVAPSTETIRDFFRVATLLPADTREPEAEVDPDDGSVTLRWLSEGATESFSLTFFGRGEVIGFLSTSPAEPAWKINVGEFALLSEKLGQEKIANVIRD